MSTPGNSQDFLIRLLIVAQNRSAGEIQKLQDQLDRVRKSEEKEQEKAYQREVRDAKAVADKRILEERRVRSEQARQEQLAHTRALGAAKAEANAKVEAQKRADRELEALRRIAADKRVSDMREEERLRKANVESELADFKRLQKEEDAQLAAALKAAERKAKAADDVARAAQLAAVRTEAAEKLSHERRQAAEERHIEKIIEIEARKDAAQAKADTASLTRAEQHAQKLEQIDARADATAKVLRDRRIADEAKAALAIETNERRAAISLASQRERIAAQEEARAVRRAEAEENAIARARAQAQAKIEALQNRKNEALAGIRQGLFGASGPSFADEAAAVARKDAYKDEAKEVQLTTKATKDFKSELRQLENAAQRTGFSGFLSDTSKLRKEFEEGKISASQLVATISEMRREIEKRASSSPFPHLAVDYRNLATTFKQTEKELTNLFNAAENHGKQFASIMNSGVPGAEELARSLGQVSEQAANSGVGLSRFAGQLRGLGIVAALGLSQELVTSLVALGGELISVASAASLAGAALGGALASGLGQAIPVVGVLGLAFGRLKAAVQASTALEAARKSEFIQGQTQNAKSTNSTNQLANAHDTLTNALQGVARAHDAVRKAQEGVITARQQAIRNLQDLSFAEQQAQLAARGDQQSLDDARTALQTAITQGASTSDIARLQLQVDSASLTNRQQTQSTLPRAQADLATARSQGIEKAPNVVAAKDALKQAREGLAQAKRSVDQARRGIESAGASAANAAAGINSAAARADYLLGKLDKTERKTVTLLRKLHELVSGPNSPLRSITDPVVSSFNDGLDKVIGLISNPKFIKPFASLADEVGKQMKRIEDAVFGKRGLGFLRFFTGEATKNLSPFTSVLIHLGDLFGTLAKAGTKTFEDLLRSLDGFLGKLDAKSSGKNNGLKKFFAGAETALYSFIHLAGSIFSLFGALIGASADSGVKSIDDLTKTIDRATQYINGHQAKVKHFFEEARLATYELAKLVFALGVALVAAFNEKTLHSFVTFAITFLLPALVEAVRVTGFLLNIFTSLADHKITKLFVELGLSALAFNVIMGKLLKPFIGLIELVGKAGVKIAQFGELGAEGGVLAGFLVRLGKILELFAKFGKGGPVSIALGAVIFLAIELEKKFHIFSKVLDFIGGQIDHLPHALQGVATAITGIAVAAGVIASWRLLSGLIGGSLSKIRTMIGLGPKVVATEEAEAAAARGFGAPGQAVPYNPATGQVARNAEGQVINTAEGVAAGSLLSRAGSGLLRGGAAGLGIYTISQLLASQLKGKASSLISNVGKGAGAGATAGAIGGAIGGPLDAITTTGGAIAGGLAGVYATFSGKGGDKANTKAQEFVKHIQDLQAANARLSPKELLNLAKQAEDFAYQGGKGAGAMDELAHKLVKLSQHDAALQQTHKYMDGLSASAQNAAKSFEGLETTTGSVLEAIKSTVSSNLDAIKHDLGYKSKQGKDALAANFGAAIDSVDKAMQNGRVSTSKGLSDIQGYMKKALKTYGVKTSDLATFFSHTDFNAGIQAGVLQGPVLPVKKETGGWIGRAGERGKDSVLALLGRGEAVLHGGHQPIVNAGLRAIGLRGGLSELFDRVRGTHSQQPVGFASGGFVQAPGTNYSVGDEPELARRLDKLAKALHLHLIGISGYRTPQHSVEVGGFPNDPHTRGQASDTPGVEGVSESILERFGLTRPFGGRAELDHIQLFGGGKGGGKGIAGVISSVGSAVAAAVRRIVLPRVHTAGDSPFAGLIGTATAQARNVAQRQLDLVYSGLGVGGGSGGGGATSSVGRLVPGILGIARHAAYAAGVPFNADLVRALLSHESRGGENLPPHNYGGNLDPAGPFQVISDTFKQYAAPGHGNRMNPEDNADAAFRYIKARYGTLENLARKTGLLSGGYVGYNQGGPVGGSGNSDTVPAMLTPGEHVWTAAEVARAGGHHVMRALRRMLGGGGQSSGSGYKTGGSIEVVGTESSFQPYTPTHRETSYLAQITQAFAALGKTNDTKDFETKVRRLGAKITSIFDAMSAAFDKLKTDIAHKAAKASYKIVDGKVVSTLNSTQAAELNLSSVESEGSALAAQAPVLQRTKSKLQARIKSLRAQLRRKGLSAKVRKRLTAELQQLEGQLKTTDTSIDTLQSARDQNVSDRYSAQQAVADAREQEFVTDLESRSDNQLSLSNRRADLMGLAGNSVGAAQARAKALYVKGDDLLTERFNVSSLLGDARAAGDTDRVKRLTDKLADLDVALQENTAAQKDAATSIRQAQIDAISNRGSFQGGALSGVAGIYSTLEAISGSPNLGRTKQNLQQQRDVILQTLNGANGQPGLIDQLTAASGGALNLSGLDAQGIASAIGGANFDKIESGMTSAQQTQFEALINAVLSNTQALATNSQSLQQLTGATTQTFSSTAWQTFRQAIFDGSGGLLPDYQIPHMDTGGMILSDGLANLHKNEYVMPAARVDKMSHPDMSMGDTNVYVTSPTEVLDPGYVAEVIHFKRSINRAL